MFVEVVLKVLILGKNEGVGFSFKCPMVSRRGVPMCARTAVIISAGLFRNTDGMTAAAFQSGMDDIMDLWSVMTDMWYRGCG